MKTLLAIWSNADVHHRSLQSKPGGKNRDEHPRIKAVEDHLEHAIESHQTCNIVRVPLCKFVPYQNHRNAPGNADENQATHVGGFTAKQSDGQQKHQYRANDPVLQQREAKHSRLWKTSPSFS